MLIDPHARSDRDDAVRHIVYGLIPAAISFILFSWSALRPPANGDIHTIIVALGAVSATAVVGVFVWAAVDRAREEIRALNSDLRRLRRDLELAHLDQAGTELDEEAGTIPLRRRGREQGGR